MSQYAMDSPSDDNSGDDEDEIASNGPPAQETQKGSGNRVCAITDMFNFTVHNYFYLYV